MAAFSGRGGRNILLKQRLAVESFDVGMRKANQLYIKDWCGVRDLYGVRMNERRCGIGGPTDTGQVGADTVVDVCRNLRCDAGQFGRHCGVRPNS